MHGSVRGMAVELLGACMCTLAQVRVTGCGAVGAVLSRSEQHQRSEHGVLHEDGAIGSTACIAARCCHRN
jgi:hypothetical protein